MTPAQFDVVAELLGSRDPARAAARLVLIEGATTTAAAERCGLSSQSVSNAVARFKTADEKIIAAYKKTL
ncbi:TrfB-related DNA-binding protein [Massilia pseudoviolaceinigra]|uniref:TrfB-related DNA-binding protein n=1 Tax=Massilia pseudoviolaceinigra TaxID=3057165 RepID=UPI002796591F|nr:TrfB-related DNA-binding protein [Massilia sp. CCM 9206]MDQ1923572.1 MarR family transcriptional regulator [Massilia sp. CCM 9206]